MAEAELEQLYDDIAERASPAIAWNFVVGIRNHCLGLSTFPQRGTVRVEIMPGLRIVGYRRGRTGIDPGHLLRRAEHHAGIAGRPTLKRWLRWRGDRHPPDGIGDFRPVLGVWRRGNSEPRQDRSVAERHLQFSQASSRISALWICPREIEKTLGWCVDSLDWWRLYTPHERGRCA
ncbi:type II toxin-antitoxin system RelE/ParE family toxin, partial [Mesorhizobium japonicum]|uniref:type II toxin-antitoxin system RelE/ParE family toxin n=2 Tax=Phyllobacteriaceae TaxID=69277 RepID=UPI003B5D0420